jgi:hypothetical protein
MKNGVHCRLRVINFPFFQEPKFSVLWQAVLKEVRGGTLLIIWRPVDSSFWTLYHRSIKLALVMVQRWRQQENGERSLIMSEREHQQENEYVLTICTLPLH